MNQIKHQLRTLHPILLPASVLFAFFAILLAASHDGNQQAMLIMMATGLAVLVSVWLVNRQFLGVLIMGAQGFEQTQRDVARLNWIHRREIAAYERARIGGPDTGPPSDEAPPPAA